MAWRGDVQIVVSGRRSVLEALASDRVEVEDVVVSRATPKPFRKELGAACRARGLAAVESDGREVTRLSGEPRHDQGVVARIRLLGVSEVEPYVDTLKGTRAKRPARLVALDGVTNPQNIGMIVRSVVASGMDGLLWPTEGSPWVSGLVVKASAGTVYRTGIVRCATLAEGLWVLKRGGFTVVGLAADGGEGMWEHDPPHRSVYVLGSETEGVGDAAREVVDRWVSIPMAGEAESLNVAVAAGVVCMAVSRPPLQ